MIILQRWEPTTAKSFPSQIPFWIQVQEIPIHLWSEETLRSIANDIGYYESVEITSTSAKMRVHIDGLQPLITSSIVEFENGDEVEATLIYDKLEKHCSNFWRLDHDVKDCSLILSKEQSVAPDKRDSHAPSLRNYAHRNIGGSQSSRSGVPYGPVRFSRDHFQGSRLSPPRQHRKYESPRVREGSQNSNREHNYRERGINRPHHSDLWHSLDSSRSQYSAYSRRHEGQDFRIQQPPQSRWVEKERPTTYYREGQLGNPPSESSQQWRPPWIEKTHLGYLLKLFPEKLIIRLLMK